ncbi:MAG: hypothetical protein ACO1PI_08210 [Bacteroidota bacterium]
MRLLLFLFCLLQLGCLKSKQNYDSIEGEWYLVKDNYKSGWVIYTLDYLNIENDSVTVITSWLNRIQEKVVATESSLNIGTQSFPAKFYSDSLIINGNRYVRGKPSYYSEPLMIIDLLTDSCKKSIEMSDIIENTIAVGYKMGTDTALYYWQGNYYTHLDSLTKQLTPTHNQDAQLLPFNIFLHRELKMGVVVDLNNALRSLGFFRIYYSTLSTGKVTIFCSK